MKHIVVDFEMNNIQQKSEARRICTMETIEIGAVMLDDNLQEISSFRTYVKPEYNDGIAKKITTEILRQYFINHTQSIDKYTFLQNSAFTHWVKEKCSKMC